MDIVNIIELLQRSKF